MRLDKPLLDTLTAQAKASPRLRMHYDLRDSAEDQSQKMLNALEPGTVLPIHRHASHTEVLTVLRGHCIQYLYDENGRQTGSVDMRAGSDCMGMVVETGQWHRLESLESGTVILECKEGAYAPLAADDIFPEEKR